MDSRIPIEPKVYTGEPPKDLHVNERTGDLIWTCECGAQGTSSTVNWANSDVERHRQMHHRKEA